MTGTITAGGMTITALLDGFYEDSREVLRHRDGEASRATALAIWGEGKLSFPVNCFLLRRGGETMLIDAGTGTGWGPAFGQMRSLLASEGIAPETIDRIFLTHLHGDHAFGLLAEDRAFFPRAEVIIPETDLAFFTDEEARARTPAARRGAFDLTRRIIAAYGPRLLPRRPGAGPEGITLLPLPGHTPGHSGYLLGAGTESLMIWGDMLHLGAFQAADPGIGLAFDLDAERAYQTRTAGLAAAADEGWIVAGSHLAGFHKVVRSGAAFALAPLAA